MALTQLASSSHTHPTTSPKTLPIWLYDVFLGILFLGPAIAPLFRATQQPVLTDLGELATYVLGSYICPTPAQAYPMAGYAMAVCARCWGATVGLWVARAFVPAALESNDGMTHLLHRFRALPVLMRLLLVLIPFLFWPLEIIGTAQQWWALPPLWVLLVNGAQAGFAAGIFFMSLMPSFWQNPPAHAPAQLA